MSSLSPAVTLVIAFLCFRKDTLPQGQNAEVLYGEEPAKLPAPGHTALPALFSQRACAGEIGPLDLEALSIQMTRNLF